jgi:urease accessory protein
LAAEDGSLVAVHSAAERVLVVTASERLTLMRAAYHLGNRHVPVEIGESELRIGHDAVLADMLSRLGANVEEKALPFEPEAGAYGGGHRHGHDATFEDDHALAQAAFKSHAKPEHPAESQYGEPGQKDEYRRRTFAPDAHSPDSVQREMRFLPRRPRPK